MGERRLGRRRLVGLWHVQRRYLGLQRRCLSGRAARRVSARLLGGERQFDGDTKTGWAEGADGDGVGEWFEISASSLQEVTGISILSGYCKSEDLYYKNNRPKDVTVTLSDGSQYSYTLSDECGSYQQLDFGSPRQTNSIRVTIDSVYGGTKWSDTVVSEVEAY